MRQVLKEFMNDLKLEDIHIIRNPDIGYTAILGFCRFPFSKESKPKFYSNFGETEKDAIDNLIDFMNGHLKELKMETPRDKKKLFL